MRERGSSLILLFHTTEERDLPSLMNLGNIRPAVFERLCKVLKEEFDLIGLQTLVDGLSGNCETSGRHLAMTFDDGGKSYASFAAPIAGSFGIPTSCFLITDCVGDNTLYWRYLYNYCVHSGQGKKLAGMIGAEYGTYVKEDEVVGFTRRNYDIAKNRNIMECILRRIISAEEYREKEGELFLSLDDITRLKTDPLVAFGVHTRTHPVMKALGEEEIQDEISGSVGFYRGNIGDEVPMFSVPFGRLYRDYDERTVLAALQLDVPAVLSAYGGRNEKDQPVYNLRRIPVTEALLEDGVGAFVRLLRDADVALEYIEREKSLGEAVERWRNRASS
jgi:peptidoglycan/xylan/chitin deacetylase (PgdA/CDA1 family)